MIEHYAENAAKENHLTPKNYDEPESYRKAAERERERNVK